MCLCLCATLYVNVDVNDHVVYSRVGKKYMYISVLNLKFVTRNLNTGIYTIYIVCTLHTKVLLQLRVRGICYYGETLKYKILIINTPFNAVKM